MAFPPWWANRRQIEISVCCFFFAAGQARNGAARRCGDFVAQSEQNCRRLSRNQVLSDSRTNVLRKSVAGQSFNTALHLRHAQRGPKLRNGAAALAATNLTRSAIEVSLI
jgi:hypothetical protein